MGLTTLAGSLFADAIVGAAGYSKFNNANSSIGVGDSATAFAGAQTDLQASTNKFRKPMDATYPQVASNAITWRATFGTADAVFAWQEWALFNTTSASGGQMLNRKVSSLGTKGAATWQMTVTVTLNIA